MKADKILHDQIMEVVSNQMRNNDPPETKQTFDRLVKSGISRSDAMKYIGQCVATEIYSVMKKQEPFNEKRFVKNLNNLPAKPTDEE
jgi:hypothetical protein